MKATLLSVKELAQELGISEISVRRAYWKKEIPVERICRMLRFDLAKVRHAMQLRDEQRSRNGGRTSRGAATAARARAKRPR